MKKPQECMPAIEACLQNAEKLISAAHSSAVPGSYHIAVMQEKYIPTADKGCQSALLPLLQGRDDVQNGASATLIRG
jgi:hypothetical protein